MAMNIGSLVAYLELETAKFEAAAKDAGAQLPGWMKTAGVAAAVAVGAAFAGALVGAINTEAANDKVAGQLGLTEAEAERAGEAAAGAYGNAFGDSLDTVSATTAGVISSIRGMRDANVSDLQNIVEKVQTLSDGFEIEADRISQVVGQMLSTGLASSAEEGLDLLTAALQKVPAAVREDIMDAADEYGPFFAGIGMSGEQAMGALVAASEKGMYGIDKTGDAVKEFSIRSTDMSTASVAAYEAAGLSAEEMAAKILAGGETGKEGFRQVVEGLLSIEDPVERANAAIGLFGTPLEDLGVNEIPGFLSSLVDATGGLGDFEGAAGRMSDVVGGNLATSWESMTRQIGLAGSAVGEKFLPIIGPALEAVGGAFEAITPHILSFADGITSFLGNTELAVPVLAGLGTMIYAILAPALWAAVTATWAFTTALLANPITWVVIAVGLLVAAIVALVMNWDSVVAWITEVWGGFIGWLTGVTEGLAAWWNGMWAGFGSWVTSVWDGFIGWITGVWSGFVGWLQGIGDGLASWWNGLWSGIGSFFQGLWGGLVSWAVGVVSGWLNGWRSIFSGLVGFFSGIWSNISSGVTGAWEGVMGFLGSIPGRIRGFFNGIGSWLLNAGKDLIGGFIDGIESMIGAVGDAVGGVMDFVAGFFPHSPAKRGPFSGSGWTAVLGAGQAISEQFARGLHGSDPFGDTQIEAALRLNTAGRGYHDTDDYSGGGVGPAPAGTEFHYHAAENQSLSSEEALYAALGSPRSPFGGK